MDCPWRGHLGGDDLCHIMPCPRVGVQMQMMWPRMKVPASEKEALSFFLLLDKPTADEAVLRFFLADLVVKAYQGRCDMQPAALYLDGAFEERIRHWTRFDANAKFRQMVARLNSASRSGVR